MYSGRCSDKKDVTNYVYFGDSYAKNIFIFDAIGRKLLRNYRLHWRFGWHLTRHRVRSGVLCPQRDSQFCARRHNSRNYLIKKIYNPYMDHL